MVDIFRGMGLEAVPTVGSQFNPETHDGIMKEDSETEADGTILEEFRKGFMFNGKLLRPAMVKVAVNSKPSTESDNDNLGAPSEQADAADAA
jgi:molecular chaperone GrpE